MINGKLNWQSVDRRQWFLGFLSYERSHKKPFFRRVRRCPKNPGVLLEVWTFRFRKWRNNLCNKIKVPHRRLYPHLTGKGGEEGVWYIVEFTGLPCGPIAIKVVRVFALSAIGAGFESSSGHMLFLQVRHLPPPPPPSPDDPTLTRIRTQGPPRIRVYSYHRNVWPHSRHVTLGLILSLPGPIGYIGQYKTYL